VPIGAHAEVIDSMLHLQGLIAALDGSRLVRDEVRGPAAEAGVMGRDLAGKLLAMGGDAILEEVRRGS
jgi:hydroxymethylbilane synthase